MAVPHLSIIISLIKYQQHGKYMLLLYHKIAWAMMQEIREELQEKKRQQQSYLPQYRLLPTEQG